MTGAPEGRAGKVDFTAFRHPVLAVACPTCRARAGAWCKRPSGHRASDFHASRKAEADRVWELQGDPPITRTATCWAYAYGEEEDSPPPMADRQLPLFGEGEGR